MMASWRKFYGRKSQVTKDSQDLDVFAHQINPMLRRAEREGRSADPSEVLVEVGSGESIAERPLFREIMEEVEALPPGAGGELWTPHVDRLSRGPMPERCRIQESFKRAHIRVVTRASTYDLTSREDEARFERDLFESRSEFNQICRRMREARDELTLKGEIVTGRAPFGYTWERNRPEGLTGPYRGRLRPKPGEFELVQQIYAAAPEKSAYRIAAETGLPPTRVRQILTNPVYTGWPARHSERHCYQTPGKYGNRRLKREAWTWPEQPGDYPPAVSRTAFEAVQETLIRRYTRREKTGETDGWARDLLVFDGVAGRVSLASKRWAGRQVPVYGISGPNRSLLACASREWINRVARTHVLAALSAPTVLTAALAEYQHEQQARLSVDHAGRAAQTRSEIGRLRRRLVNLKLAFADADDLEEQRAIRTAEALVKGQLEALKAALAGQERQDTQTPAFPAVARLVSLAPSVLSRLWEQQSDHQRRLLAQELLARIVVRITPRPHPERWLREIVAAQWADWLQPFAGGLPLVKVERE
jgi:hypothetical protein